MLISASVSGDFKNFENDLKRLRNVNLQSRLSSAGKLGVEALSKATPVDTGKTSESWTYTTYIGRNQIRIDWHNTNVNKNVNIALILQYGHGTINGGYVRGIDYINPAIKPVFDRIAIEIGGLLR